MGNLLSSNKSKSDQNIYEPFVNKSQNYINVMEQMHQLVDQIQKLADKNRFLEEELKIYKRELDTRTSRIDTSIQNKYNELSNIISHHNEKNNEKIGIITKDMENLLNNDKILLDKLIEKNIVSTIQEE